MKKGFIFSIIALYFLILILVFFSIYTNVYDMSAYKQKNTLYEQNLYDFLNNQSSINNFGNNYWCATYLVYDLDTTEFQKTIVVKNYCENYGSKRYI